MKKIWVHKSNSLKETEEFEKNYYLCMSAKQRLDIIQYLRELYFKIGGQRHAHRKRLRRVIKIIQ